MNKSNNAGRWPWEPVTLFLLALFLFLFFGTGCGPAPVTSPWGDVDGRPGKLNYTEAAALAAWAHDQSERAGDPPQAPTQTDLYAWALTLVPAYELEGVTPRGRYPPDLSFKRMPTGERHAFVAGVSNCDDYAVLNLRYVNPHDTWYGRGNYVAVLAHELAHVQQDGNCRRFPVADIENAAQVASWEILAALANEGNLEATQALLYELRGAALGAARYQALVEHREEAYAALRSRLNPGAIYAARVARNDRYWSRHRERLLQILYKYEIKPWEMILAAQAGDGQAELVAGYEGRSALELDDLIYFLSHAEAITAELARQRSAGALLGEKIGPGRTEKTAPLPYIADGLEAPQAGLARYGWTGASRRNEVALWS